MTTRWFYSCQAIDPNDPPDSFWEVGVSERLFRRLQNQGDARRLARLVLVEEVLVGGTDEIYAGWSRPGKEEDCFVYVGRPKSDYKSASIVTPPPKGMVFLVFVLRDGTIDEWTWRSLSEVEGESNRPDGVKGKVIWPKNQT